jgi:hypothetical protein
MSSTLSFAANSAFSGLSLFLLQLVKTTLAVMTLAPINIVGANIFQNIFLFLVGGGRITIHI